MLTPGLLANRISKPRRGGRDTGVLENVATCVTPPGFRLPVGTYHLGLAPQAIACHASSVPNRVCRGVEMAVEKKASLAAKKRMCLVAISAGEHPMKIAIVDDSQFRWRQTS